ncbi:MAG TPA: DUF4349 domain-containing protein [Streptosporangiaceae bacterium]|nr:DUF4349 domain-containing protein [Streptosporangiaceae bacterium]
MRSVSPRPARAAAGARWIIAPAIGLGLLLSACSSGSSASSASSGFSNGLAAPAPGDHNAAGIPSGAPVPSAAGGSAAAGSEAAGSAAGRAPAPPGTGITAVHLSPASIIYTAEMTVRASNVPAATDQARQITEAAGGYVSSESLATAKDSSASVTLKIPVTLYPQTLNGLATQLGKRLSLQQQAQDVTQQVTDVNSQVASYQAAISQLRALLSHAGSVADLLSVQNQINDEEAGLEQLEAEQRALGQQTGYATVTLTIVPAATPPVQHKAAGTPGLTRGLKAGWHALRTAFSWTLAILGALAPFLAIAAAAAFIAYRTRRWLLHRRSPAHQPE